MARNKKVNPASYMGLFIHLKNFWPENMFPFFLKSLEILFCSLRAPSRPGILSRVDVKE
jgi:hypothetical protein